MYIQKFALKISWCRMKFKLAFDNHVCKILKHRDSSKEILTKMDIFAHYAWWKILRLYYFFNVLIRYAINVSLDSYS